jgi:pimeloyl-ACP methyl ester carboxylesterase
MSRFVLIPGAGGAGWYWHRVVPLLEAAGHQAVALDLPADDETAGLAEYAALAAAAAADPARQDRGTGGTVLVAQSLGGFTAPLVCDLVPVELLVLLNAMIPVPGETAGDWWDAVGATAARDAAAQAGGYPPGYDLETYFTHDVPPEIAAAGEPYQKPEAEIAFSQPCDIKRWPDVPTRVVAGRDDRFFPVAFQRQVARDRLGLDTDEVPGGHLAALSYPAELAERLLTYLA